MQRILASIRETAEVLNLSPASVNRRVRSGEIASVKIGKRRLVPVSEHARLAGVDPSNTARAA